MYHRYNGTQGFRCPNTNPLHRRAYCRWHIPYIPFHSEYTLCLQDFRSCCSNNRIRLYPFLIHQLIADILIGSFHTVYLFYTNASRLHHTYSLPLCHYRLRSLAACRSILRYSQDTRLDFRLHHMQYSAHYTM